MTLECDAKFEEERTCGLKNDMRNLAKSSPEYLKCQNWYFHGILLSNVKNAWAANLKGSCK